MLIFKEKRNKMQAKKPSDSGRKVRHKYEKVEQGLRQRSMNFDRSR